MNTKFRTGVALLLLGPFLMTPAFAQWQDRDAPILYRGSHHRHASTFEEGVLRGWADVGRASGEYNYNTALARVHNQEAVRRAMVNRTQQVYGYFDVRKYNQDVRFPSNERPNSEQMARINQDRLPDRLTTQELSPASKTLQWPSVLAQDRFADSRQGIERALLSRTPENSGVGSKNYQEVRKLADHLEDLVRADASKLTTDETITARKFIDSLRYEVRFPITVELSGLAAR